MHLSIFCWLFSPRKNYCLFSTSLPCLLLSVLISAIIYMSSTTSCASFLCHPFFVLHIRCVSAHHHHHICYPLDLCFPHTTVSFVSVISSLTIVYVFCSYGAGMPTSTSAIPPHPLILPTNTLLPPLSLIAMTWIPILTVKSGPLSH